jgi:osmotically-inducible protein OsmY
MAMFRGMILAIVCCVPLLQGCAAAVIGAAVGSTAVLLDSRDVNRQIDDSGIRLELSTKLQQNTAFTDQRVKFVAYNGDILLYGQAENASIAQQAEQYARETSGAVNVFNQIRIRERANFITRTDDTWITTRVKTLLLREQQYETSGIKVITENNEVFLLGVVDSDAADRAIDIARHVRGVEKVVNVLTISP